MQEDSGMIRGVRRGLHGVAGGIAMATLVGLSAWHHGGSLLAWFNNMVRQPMDFPMFVAPCLVFGLTIFTYFEFIVDYKGYVAAISFIGSLIAIPLCLGLVEVSLATPAEGVELTTVAVRSKEWAQHIRLIFALFASYALWDVLMIDVLLPSEIAKLGTTKATKHLEELTIVSRLINQPTLFTLFVVWVFARFVLYGRVASHDLDTFVAGVVSFHLTFASVAYVATLVRHRRPDVESVMSSGGGSRNGEEPTRSAQ